MMRAFIICCAFLMLPACGCVRDRGDSKGTWDYLGGCWDEAKDNRRDTFVYPHDDLQKQ